MQYIKHSKTNVIGIKTKLEKQIEFYVNYAIINMQKENIDRKLFEDMNELNLTYFNSLLPLNNKIDFNGALWQQLHQCNIKFEGLKNEKIT